MHFINNTVNNACYEAARRGIVPGITDHEVREEANLLMSSASINGTTVTVEPEPIQPSTQQVTVTIVVPLDGNGWIAPLFFGGKTISATTTLAREDYNSP